MGKVMEQAQRQVTVEELFVPNIPTQLDTLPVSDR